ncbi:MAG TPA: hypothetical protein DIU15_10270, partial [Deltaproteobacteria bacterium]|nr:hypothetical protein [Deltaproteobacteria bacterium]
MGSVDEPIFEDAPSGRFAARFQAPTSYSYIGATAEGEIASEMPTLYLDWGVARVLQSEGQRSIATDKEVAGILLGTTSPDNQTIKVSHIAIARDEDSSPVHFKFTFSVWDDLIDQMERMSQEAGQELLLLGWYHTHPNMAVFLSLYDLLTHRDFHRPYQFALVLAPRLGTTETSVGFFCNRGDGTPLLPGIRMFGSLPSQEVGSALPWRFQTVEAEAVEEGEPTSDQEEPTVPDIQPVMHQVGLARQEDPDWLTLGVDVNEGAVLPILEAMASYVVEQGRDRLGVLLGTRGDNDHITITRVRFLSALAWDPAEETEELLLSLSFMARTFPADKEQKILGIVRIVDPHQLRKGQHYNPLTHNIRVSELLREVGYDLQEVPIQVALVLYPGVEHETFLFQAFRQNNESPPVLLGSFQAEAPAQMHPNERYEPVPGDFLEVEQDPCLMPPTILYGVSGTVSGLPSPLHEESTVGTTTSEVFLTEATHTGPGINWDTVRDDGNRLVVVGRLPVLLGLMGVLLLLVGVLVVFQFTSPFETMESAETELEPELWDTLGAEPAPALDPYEYKLVGCGEGWNVTLPCRPFTDEHPKVDAVPLLFLRELDPYSEHTIQPIDVWLVPHEGDGRPRMRLERKPQGDGYVFSVKRWEGRWQDLWGDGGLFPVSLVIAPHGTELVLADELSFLRRSEELEVVGWAPPSWRALGRPSPRTRAPAAGRSEPASAAVDAAPASDGEDWAWHNAGTEQRVSYDLRRQVFNEILVVSGGEEPDGTWVIRYRGDRAGGVVVDRSFDGLTVAGGRVDLSAQLTQVMRETEVVRHLEVLARERPPVAHLGVQPPGLRSSELSLKVTLAGLAVASSVNHKVCIMMAGPDGKAVRGEAQVSGVGEMRPTFDPGAREG